MANEAFKPEFVTPSNADILAERMAESKKLAKPPPPADTTSVSERLARVETSVSWFQWSLGIMVAVMFGGFALVVAIELGTRSDLTNLSNKVDQNSASLNAKIDNIGPQLDRRFDALEARIAAQTSAIANSITAARQMTPAPQLPSPPEIQVPNRPEPRSPRRP